MGHRVSAELSPRRAPLRDSPTSANLEFSAGTKRSAGPFVLTLMKLITMAACTLALGGAAILPSFAQSGESQLAFEVASVKPNNSDAPARSNFPLNAGSMHTANGGLFSATNFPLVTYIFFAYNILGNRAHFLVPQLPGWVMSECFDIQARAAGNPTKDQMRLMMRTLLADRFKLAVHTGMRDAPVLALVLPKPGRTGPQLQPHPAGAPCPTSVEPPSAANPVPDIFSQKVPGFPAICNSILGIPPQCAGPLTVRGTQCNSRIHGGHVESASGPRPPDS